MSGQASGTKVPPTIGCVRAWRWWNFWIPLGLGLVVAGAISDQQTHGWTRRQGIGWMVIIFGWPLFTFLAVAFVGFLCGVIQ